MKEFKLKIEGENIHNFLNALKDRKIKIKNIKLYDDFVTFQTNLNGFKKISSLYSHSNYKISVLKSPTYENKKDFFVKNIGIFLAMFLFFACVFFYNQHIWQLKIYGNQLLTEQSIMKLLKENGVTIGANKSKLDFEKIEKLLISQDEVALASVNIVGSSLVINLSEKLNNDTLLNNDQPLISNYDCIITKIKTISGTPLVKVGDKVAKGQKLVDNSFTNEKGETMKASASAEIYADCFLTYTKTFFKTEMKLERTGRKKTINDFKLFGLNLGKNKIPFEKYETQSKQVFLSDILPIKINQITFFELKQVQVENNLDDLKGLESVAVDSAKQKFHIETYDDLLVSCEKNGENVIFSITFVVNKKIA